jgi:hypothetical protein
MALKEIALLGVVALSAFGCASPVPVADNFPLTYQKVARTAQHWDVVADDVVAQTAGVLATNQALQSRAIFVPPTPRNTAFDATFRDFVINHMVDRGMPVSVCSSPGGTGMVSNPDVRVRYETRVIGHAQMPSYRPGVLTALAAGVFVGRSIALSDVHPDAAGVAAFGAVALADLATGHIAKPTHTELVVTTTIEENNQFVMRRSDIYYVPDGDVNLFTRRVAGSALCPPNSQPGTTVSSRDPAEDENARQELVIQSMRRSNPSWRPGAIAFSN